MKKFYKLLRFDDCTTTNIDSNGGKAFELYSIMEKMSEILLLNSDLLLNKNGLNDFYHWLDSIY